MKPPKSKFFRRVHREQTGRESFFSRRLYRLDFLCFPVGNAGGASSRSGDHGCDRWSGDGPLRFRRSECSGLGTGYGARNHVENGDRRFRTVSFSASARWHISGGRGTKGLPAQRAAGHSGGPESDGATRFPSPGGECDGHGSDCVHSPGRATGNDTIEYCDRRANQ